MEYVTENAPQSQFINMKKIAFIIAALILPGFEKKPTTIDTSLLRQYFEESSLPAAMMGYATKDGTPRWYAFGPAIWNHSDTVSEKHIFRILSMTKAISSVAALQLVERGLIGLNDPLNDLMPEMTSIPILTADGALVKSDKVITLRHLMTHTSGFGAEGLSARLTNFKPKTWNHEDKPRLFEPGTQWQYGTSTDWVGKIIEKASGQDLETYFRDNITGPLQMNHTWFNVPDSLEHLIVSWGARDSTGFRENQRIRQKPVTTYSAGSGLFGSPEDYLSFLTCLLNGGKYPGGQLLKPETVDMIFKDQLPHNLTIDYELPDELLSSDREIYQDESDKHGLAWAIENNPAEKIRPRGSGYWGGAANSFYTIDNTNKIAIVYFTQFFPFNDKESFGFYRLFEKEVFAGTKNR